MPCSGTGGDGSNRDDCHKDPPMPWRPGPNDGGGGGGGDADCYFRIERCGLPDPRSLWVKLPCNTTIRAGRYQGCRRVIHPSVACVPAGGQVVFLDDTRTAASGDGCTLFDSETECPALLTLTDCNGVEPDIISSTQELWAYNGKTVQIASHPGVWWEVAGGGSGEGVEVVVTATALACASSAVCSGGTGGCGLSFNASWSVNDGFDHDYNSDVIYLDTNAYSSFTFSGSSDDVVALIASDQLMTVVDGGSEYTITIPGSSIIFDQTFGAIGTWAGTRDATVVSEQGSYTWLKEDNEDDNHLSDTGWTLKTLGTSISVAELSAKGFIDEDGIACFRIAGGGDNGGFGCTITCNE